MRDERREVRRENKGLIHFRLSITILEGTGLGYPEDAVRDSRFYQEHQHTLDSRNAWDFSKVLLRTTSVPPVSVKIVSVVVASSNAREAEPCLPGFAAN